MPWIKLDDHFDEHPKVAQAGPIGIALWISAIAYCNRNLTDGYVPKSVAQRLIDGRGIVLSGHPKWDGNGEPDPWFLSVLVLEDLVALGLLEEVADGYRIHDYDQYQPSKAAILAERERTRSRVERHRNATGNAVTNGAVTPEKRGSNTGPVPVPVPKGLSIESPPPISPKEEEPYVMLSSEEKKKRREQEKLELMARTMQRLGVRP